MAVNFTDSNFICCLLTWADGSEFYWFKLYLLFAHLSWWQWILLIQTLSVVGSPELKAVNFTDSNFICCLLTWADGSEFLSVVGSPELKAVNFTDQTLSVVGSPELKAVNFTGQTLSVVGSPELKAVNFTDQTLSGVGSPELTAVNSTYQTLSFVCCCHLGC